MLGVISIGMSDKVNITCIVLTIAVITLEFASTTSCAVDVFANMLINARAGAVAGKIIGATTGAGVGVLADVNVNVFAAVMTDLECDALAP